MFRCRKLLELAVQSHDILLANSSQTGLDLIVITGQVEYWLEHFKTELPDPMEIPAARGGQVSCLGVHIRPQSGLPSKCAASESGSTTTHSLCSSASSSPSLGQFTVSCTL